MHQLVLDTVLQDLETHVAAHPPERGGALLGPLGLRAVSALILDEEARTTSVTYQPSTWLADEVRGAEGTRPVELKAIVHSHPRNLDCPSAPDCEEAAEGLRRNPHLAVYGLPIITAGGGPARQPHELALPAGKASFYAATRTRRGGVEVEPVAVTNLPMGASVARAAEVLGLPEAPVLCEVMMDGAPLLATAGLSANGCEWSLLAPWTMLVPPTVLRDGRPVTLPWDLTLPAADRLASGLQEVVTADARRSVRTAPPPAVRGHLPTSREARLVADRLLSALHRRFQPAPEVAGRLDRSASILAPEHARTRRVLVVGCGSVGSAVAEFLVRTGIGRFTLVDPDRVEAPNLSRTSYGVADIGRRKVHALAARMAAADPGVRLRPRPQLVDESAEPWLGVEVANADLVVAATDDPAAQLLLDRLAFEAGVPAVFMGLTAGAQGGEVLMVVPGQTACYGCALALRQGQPSSVRRTMDYGAERLQAEPALGCDITLLTSAAARLCLSLLAPKGSNLAGFAAHAVAAGTTFLTIGMTPEYWCFPKIFDGVPGQYAFQSVWMVPTSRLGCPRCGEPSDPPSADFVIPRTHDLRGLAQPNGGRRADAAPTFNPSGEDGLAEDPRYPIERKPHA